MNFEPEKLFIGLIDFFSTLLPGALLTFMMKDTLGPRFLGDAYNNLAGTEGWIVFLFTSYLLGHFIFLIGSWLLDDHVYDPIRNATYDVQIRRLAKGEKLSRISSRVLARLLFKKDVDKAVDQAIRIKEHYLDPLKASSAINAFQWAKARLTLDHPQAMPAIQRFEADSKFFRSLLVVLCVLILFGIVMNRQALSLFSALSLVPAFWRFVDQRVKATNQAYWYIITIAATNEIALRPTTPRRDDQPSHAGGVVFRKRCGQVEYLLVQARNKPKEWVLPKGHIESGELMQETAVREVREETGTWASIRDELKPLCFEVDGKSIKVKFYLMEFLARTKQDEPKRESLWKPLENALTLATHEESRELLKLAEQRRSEGGPEAA